jgi:hypothetical protein
MRIRHLVFTLPLIVLLAGARPAQAGPPLICHPFQTDGTASLPWAGGPGWNTPDPSYDIRRVPADTMRLLAAEKRILPRMETLRRAAIYASRDPRVAYELLANVLGRALRAAAVGSPDDLAWFDAGYLVETFKQATGIQVFDTAAKTGNGATLREQLAALDGYAWTRRALELSGGSPDIEFAASLMKDGAAAEQHRRKAAAGAPAGSLLARALTATEPGPPSRR